MFLGSDERRVKFGRGGGEVNLYMNELIRVKVK